MKKKLLTTIIMLALTFSLCFQVSASSTSGLVYSGLYSIPSNLNYNCYGYANGTNTTCYPGQYSGISPYVIVPDPATVRNYVLSDLVALGYTNVRQETASYTLQSGETMICLVVGLWHQNQNYLSSTQSEVSSDSVNFMENQRDYHFFIKSSSGGLWRHKFGTSSAIMYLKNGNTPGSITVTNELYTSSGVAQQATFYMSSVYRYYIVFDSWSKDAPSK